MILLLATLQLLLSAFEPDGWYYLAYWSLVFLLVWRDLYGLAARVADRVGSYRVVVVKALREEEA